MNKVDLEVLKSIYKDIENSHLEAISIICEALNVSEDKIEKIEILKKGMTNNSFIFTVNNVRYILRIPGEGTSELIDRFQEAEVYSLIKDKNILENLFTYSLYKTTVYLLHIVIRYIKTMPYILTNILKKNSR